MVDSIFATKVHNSFKKSIFFFFLLLSSRASGRGAYFAYGSVIRPARPVFVSVGYDGQEWKKLV